jgi:isocitrate dehydrogenase
MYWAQALAEQTKDPELQQKFLKLAQNLTENEDKINEELLAAQGKSVDLGGYYKTNFEKVSKAMRPSETFNAAIEALAVVNV